MTTPPGIEVLRRDEHATVRWLCRHPGSGHPGSGHPGSGHFGSGAGVLMIQGEAGIGKSALLHAGLRDAARAGHRTLRSVAVPGERGLAYAGLLELLAGMPDETWADLPEPQRDALDVVLRHRPGDPARLAPQTVGMAVVSVLRRYAGRGPVIVVIDNLQWLDDASRDALSFAARRVDGVPVLLAATARTVAPWAVPDCDGVEPVTTEAVTLAVRRQHLVTLSPLDQRQTRHLLRAAHGLELSDADAERVRRWTRGNTFWALRVGADMAGRWRTGDDLPVPDLARVAARRWIETAPSDTVDALVTVAAAGRLPIRSAVAALDPVVSDAGAALDAAVVAGLVTEDEGQLMPAHPLFGEAARLTIPPVRRADLHRRLAAHSNDPYRRAKHLALAAGGGRDEAAAAAMTAAAVSAAGHGDTRGAGELASTAVRLTPPEDQLAERTRRVLAAEYLTSAGATGRAWHVLAPVDLAEVDQPLEERALPLHAELLAARGETAAARAAVAAALARTPPHGARRALALSVAAHERHGDADRLVLAAEAVADAERSAACAPIVHRAVSALLTARTEAGAGLDRVLFDQLRDLERRWEVPRAHRCADALLGVLSRYSDQLDRSRPLLRRCLRRATRAGDDDGANLLRLHLAEAERLAGDVDTAAALIAETGPTHGGAAAPGYLAVAAHGAVLVARGRLAEARDLARAHASRLAEAGDGAAPSRDRLAVAYLNGVVALRRGETAPAVAELSAARREADALGVHEPSARFLLDADLAEALVLAERYPQALAIAADLAARADGAVAADLAVHADSAVDAGLAVRADSAVDAGLAVRADSAVDAGLAVRSDSAVAADLAARADGVVAADLAVRGRRRPVLAGVAARIEGLVAMARGDLSGAARRVAEATECHERGPIPGELGRTLLVLGRVERRRRSRRRARAALERAATIFESIGDVGLARQASEERRRLTDRRSSRGPTSNGPTSHEPTSHEPTSNGPVARASTSRMPTSHGSPSHGSPSHGSPSHGSTSHGSTSHGSPSYGLTEVERRVAELLADGATTRNAASRLFISVRTVEAHVTAIYRKLGVRSRAELARAVITDQRALS